MIVWPGKKLFAALPLVGLLGIVPVASAESPRWESRRSTEDMSARDLRSFENYLDSHREIARQLSESPDLIRDRRFVRNNESLDEWLDAHPEAAEALRENPHKYLWQERASRYPDERQALSRMSERDLYSFERFLDTNPETARRLYEEPDLINDRQFVRNQETLDEWLDNHPDAARALQANPHKFLWRERSVGVTDFLGQLLQPSR